MTAWKPWAVGGSTLDITDTRIQGCARAGVLFVIGGDLPVPDAPSPVPPLP